MSVLLFTSRVCDIINLGDILAGQHFLDLWIVRGKIIGLFQLYDGSVRLSAMFKLLGVYDKAIGILSQERHKGG